MENIHCFNSCAPGSSSIFHLRIVALTQPQMMIVLVIVMVIINLCGLIVRVRVVPRRTIVADIDRRVDNLSRSLTSARNYSHPDDQTTCDCDVDFEPNYQTTNSPFVFPYISYRSSVEELLKYQ